MSLLAVLSYGGTLVASGEITVGTLTSFLLYRFVLRDFLEFSSVYMMFSIGQISGFYTDIMKAAGAGTRVFQLMDRLRNLDEISQIRQPLMRIEGGRKLDDLQGNIKFQNVTFSY